MKDSQRKKEVSNTSRSTHDKYTDSYIGILDQYKELLSKSVEKKNALKEEFFNVIKVIMYWMIGVFSVATIGSIIAICIAKSPEVLAGAIVSVLSSFATMMASIFKLPEIIAKYLFNKKEDNLMKDIIENIQNYEIKASDFDKQDIMESMDIMIKGSSSTEDNIIEEDIVENDMNEMLENSPHKGDNFPSDATEDITNSKDIEQKR